MSKDNFFKNSFLLTASNITTGIIGFIFSIYLSKVIGPEGMGLYNLVMPIYNLFICVMTAGVAASISQISAVYTSKKENTNLSEKINSLQSQVDFLSKIKDSFIIHVDGGKVWIENE